MSKRQSRRHDPVLICSFLVLMSSPAPSAAGGDGGQASVSDTYPIKYYFSSGCDYYRFLGQDEGPLTDINGDLGTEWTPVARPKGQGQKVGLSRMIEGMLNCGCHVPGAAPTPAG